MEQVTHNVYPLIITGINVAILFILGVSFRMHYIARKLDTVFHSRMLLLCTLLLLANTFAFITGVYSYFILHHQVPEILSFGRFADRYAMMFAYLTLQKILRRED